MTVFTDIHGNFDTFLALYNKIPQEAKDKGVAIAGDLIDRGPKSAQMVQWCIDHPEVKVVKGNHEEMMIDEALIEASYFIKNSTRKDKKCFCGSWYYGIIHPSGHCV